MSLLALGALISAGGKVYSGLSKKNAADALASDLRIEGEILFNESLRTAAIIEEEGYKFAARQTIQYIGSGVQVTGSVLITTAQTTKYAKTEANAIRVRGELTKGLANRKADRAQSEGRAALVSGIIGATGSFVSTVGGTGKLGATSTPGTTSSVVGVYGGGKHEAIGGGRR